MHVIGIDFGTTKTLVSRIVSETGRPETVRLGQGTDHLSSAIYITAGGEMVFGDDADDCIADTDGVYLRGFKMRLGSSIPIHLRVAEGDEVVPYTAADLVQRYLAYVRMRVQETVFSGEPVTHAVITRPVNFSPAQCEELRQAARAAGFEQVVLTTEPEAAGLAFCRLNDACAFQHNALVVDWGGGTLDFALVTRQNDTVAATTRLTAGDMTMGGELFDTLLWQYAEAQLQEQGVSGINPVTMLPIVRKNKEKLSTIRQCAMRLSSETGGCPPVTLTQELFNGLIAEYVERAAEKVMQLLAKIPQEQAPELLVLVGGSCRIPLIKEKLESVCGLPAVSWHFSREAVALGAILSASSAPAEPDCAPEPSTKPTAPEAPPAPALAEDEPAVQKENLLQQPQAKRKRRRWCYFALSMVLLAGIAAGGYYCYHHFYMTPQRILANRGITESEYDSCLISAVRENDVELVRLLLAAGADANVKSPDGNPALMWAASKGYPEVVEMLLAAGADVNAKGFGGYTPLIWAASKGHAEVAKVLISSGADVNYGAYTPLMGAAENGHAEVVKVLIASGADVNYGAYTPLIRAASKGHAEIVKVLISSGADVNAKGCGVDTPLIWAASKGHAEVVKVLIASGADVEARNSYGDSALDLARQKGHTEIVKLLEQVSAR